MSRVIRFRAWDKVSKKFLFPWPDGFHILGETMCFDLLMDQLKKMRPDIPTLEMLNDLEITQFTGLLDKNKVEIYEEDIIRATIFLAEDKTETVVTKVVFQNGAFQTESDDQNVEYYHDVEVLGNVYQNPELLEKTK